MYEADCERTEDNFVYIYIEDHPKLEYTGYYFKGDDWNNYPHFSKLDWTAHLYYYFNESSSDNGNW